MKNSIIKGFIISTFVSLYLIVSIISTIHVIEFFKLSNPKWLAISLAVAFEFGAAASLASLIALDKMNKFLVWCLFIILTCMQAMGNTYYAYSHLVDFRSWSELFGLIDEDPIYQKRILSVISGAILPIVALGFIKSLVDYLKPEDVFNQANKNSDPLVFDAGNAGDVLEENITEVSDESSSDQINNSDDKIQNVEYNEIEETGDTEQNDFIPLTLDMVNSNSRKNLNDFFTDPTKIK